MPVQLSKPTEQQLGYSAVLYGPPQTGKTWTLKDKPEFKTLLVDLDHNTTGLSDAENITIAHIDSFKDYQEVYVAARDRKWPGADVAAFDYDMVAIDSFTTMERLVKDWVASSYAPNRKREIQTKFGATSDWQDLQDTEIQAVRDWQTLTKRPDRPINVLWIGHDMTLRDEVTNQPLMTQIALQGKYASIRIMGAVDAAFYSFRATAGQFKKDTPDPSKLVYGIYTMQQGNIQAGARATAAQREALRPVIFNPKWSEIFGILGYKK